MDISLYSLVQKREELEAEFERDSLKSSDQLPDLLGCELEFIWDKETGFLGSCLGTIVNLR
jgi:hypothetical protein